MVYAYIRLFVSRSDDVSDYIPVYLYTCKPVSKYISLSDGVCDYLPVYLYVYMPVYLISTRKVHYLLSNRLSTYFDIFDRHQFYNL